MTTKRKTSKGAPSGALDIATIKDSQWGAIITNWRKGRIDRAAIVRALESGDAMPVQANMLLADLLEGRVAAKRGLKKLTRLPVSESIIAEAVESIEANLKAHNHRGTLRPNAEARALVAEALHITTAAVGRAITAHNRHNPKS